MRIKDIKGKNVKSSYALDMADVIKVDDLVKLMSAQTDLFKLDEFVIRFQKKDIYIISSKGSKTTVTISDEQRDDIKKLVVSASAK